MQRSVARTLMCEFVTASAAPGLKPFRKEQLLQHPSCRASGLPLGRRIGRHAETGRGGLLR